MFVSPSFPQEAFVHQHKPGSAHTDSPRERARLVWEMVRAGPGAMQGERAACLWLTSGRRWADPRNPGCSFDRREPEHDAEEGRVSEPQFNKPSAAPVAIPRKLINAVRCHGSALLRQTGSGTTPQLHGCQAASSFISPTSPSTLTSQRCSDL